MPHTYILDEKYAILAMIIDEILVRNRDISEASLTPTEGHRVGFAEFAEISSVFSRLHL